MSTPVTESGTQTGHLTEKELERLYWVVMHNDPVTTMDFVVMILMNVFAMSHDRAMDVMYTIHFKGLEYVARLPLEQARAKARATRMAARANGYPLTCTIEPDW